MSIYRRGAGISQLVTMSQILYDNFYVLFTWRTYVYTVFKETQSDMTCLPNDTVRFKCSVKQGEILWFVNDTFVLGLSPALNASFRTTSLIPNSHLGGSVTLNEGETSTLELIARTEANNSKIVCAVGFNNTIAKMSEPAKLITGENSPIILLCPLYSNCYRKHIIATCHTHADTHTHTEILYSGCNIIVTQIILLNTIIIIVYEPSMLDVILYYTVSLNGATQNSVWLLGKYIHIYSIYIIFPKLSNIFTHL